MPGLPRSIIKKYGVTKKAWQIFRGSSGSGGSARRSPRRSRRHHTGRMRSVARRRGRSRGGGGFGMGKLLSKKNLMYTIGGVLLGAAVLKVDPKMAGAIGGFMGAGPIGAVAGYVAGPTIANLGGGLLGGMGLNQVATY